MSHGPSPAPLNALRAFEAAARHHSFTRAADELHVTHGAVSRQVQTLEDWLGLLLFERHNRRVVLTEAGAATATLGPDVVLDHGTCGSESGRLLRVTGTAPEAAVAVLLPVDGPGVSTRSAG